MVAKHKADVLERSKVHFRLSDQDILDIIAETFPGASLKLSTEKAELARKLISSALFSVSAPAEGEKRDVRPRLKDVASSLTLLKRRLDDPLTRKLLSYTGGNYLSIFGEEQDLMAAPGLAIEDVCIKDVGSYCEDTIERLHQLLSEVRRWLFAGGVMELVVQSQSDARFKPRSELIRSVLPNVYVSIFEKRCTNGSNAAGARFIAAVLRKGRVHNGSTKTIMSLVVKTRQRANHQTGGRN